MFPVALLACLCFVTACDERIHVVNVAPTITALGPVFVEDGTATVVYWVRDHEEDAIDIEIDLVQGSKVTQLDLFGGHGDVGLTTTRDEVGKAHPIQFQLDGVELSESVKLRIRAIDDHGDTSPMYESDAFVVKDGIPAP